MPDAYNNHARSLTGPLTNAVAITPHDSNDLAQTTRGLYVGVAGNVRVIFAGDTEAVTLTGLAAGMVHPFRVTRVLSTSTTATGIVGLY
jgi:hypothetical protein